MNYSKPCKIQCRVFFLQVTPSANAVQYNYSLLVEQFAFPYPGDADTILKKYKWLSGNESYSF